MCLIDVMYSGGVWSSEEGRAEEWHCPRWHQTDLWGLRPCSPGANQSPTTHNHAPNTRYTAAAPPKQTTPSDPRSRDTVSIAYYCRCCWWWHNCTASSLWLVQLTVEDLLTFGSQTLPLALQITHTPTGTRQSVSTLQKLYTSLSYRINSCWITSTLRLDPDWLLDVTLTLSKMWRSQAELCLCCVDTSYQKIPSRKLPNSS